MNLYELPCLVMNLLIQKKSGLFSPDFFERIFVLFYNNYAYLNSFLRNNLQ